MKRNKVIRVDESTYSSKKIGDVNEDLSEGWTVQSTIPVGNGVVDYILVMETPDEIENEDIIDNYEHLKEEAIRVTKQLHTALKDMDKEYRRKFFLWRFIKEAYERSEARNNKWWAKASCYFKVSKFPEIFKTYDVDDAVEIIKKFYSEEDEYNYDEEQSSENQS